MYFLKKWNNCAKIDVLHKEMKKNNCVLKKKWYNYCYNIDGEQIHRKKI